MSEADETGYNLGVWISTQRTRQESLSEERRNKLELIEFRFENKKSTLSWEEMYDLAKAYYNRHGNSEIPRGYKTKNGSEADETGYNLGVWCANQRTNHGF